MTFGIWQAPSTYGRIAIMAGQLALQLHRLTCVAALMMWLAFASPTIKVFLVGGTIRDTSVSPLWFIPFLLFGVAVLVAMTARLRPSVYWALLVLQVVAVMAMAIILPWAGMSQFLVITAWQAAMATTFRRALLWTILQTLAVIAALAQALNPDLCWVIAKSVALQLLIVFTAQALRREADTARELAQTNRELRSAQAIIANNVRNTERLRISRELHDAWGHELTALGLQLEIASHVTEPAKANEHVLKAKGLAGALLTKVRDVVSTLRQAERCDLKDALAALAQSVPTPAIHLELDPDLRVSPDQAHTLVRCAQEAITNTVRHAEAANLWLQVTSDEGGVRMVAHNDGKARSAMPSFGSGLLGMRERLEQLGGRLLVRGGAEPGFTIDAWLPSRGPQPA